MRIILLIGCSLSASVPIVFEQPPEPPEQFAESTYLLGWDIDMSPYAGGEDLLFAHRCIERIEGFLIGKSPIYYSRSASARIWRLSELILAWLPLNWLAIVTQHEVFGHGYRIRDLSDVAVVNGYSFDQPPPYGGGGALTSYSVSTDFTTTDDASVAMGGVESTAIMAILTKYKWLEAEKIDPRQVVLYLLGQYDLPLYIGTIKETTKQGKELSKGHDMIDYVKAVNQTYTASRLSSGRLRSISWMNLADPFTYYAVYAWLRYIYCGEETSIPMIPIGQAGYLPGARLGLTPFGPEYFFENFLLVKKRPIYFYGKAGSHAGNSYFGAGFYADKIFTWSKGAIGARLDLWRQPKLLTHPGNVPFIEIDFDHAPNREDPLYPLSEQHAMHQGVGLSLIGSCQLSGKSGLEAEVGYKTAGFVPGESLFRAPIARVYYTLVF
jgi:hypothetical protein